MKYLPLIAILAAISVPSFADDHFRARVAQAKKVERSPDGLAYLMRFLPTLNPKFEGAMGKCFPATGERVDFEYVADIDPNGKILNVVTVPSTAREKCFAESITGLEGPAPDTGKTVPIYVSATLK